MPEEKESLKVRLGSEMRNAFRLTLYFGVWFSALVFLNFETQGHTGWPLEGWGFAWIKAALCAKFLLIGQLLMPMPPLSNTRLWSTILPRSLLYMLVVLGLSVVEEGVRGMLHGQPFMQAISEFAGGKPLHVLAMAWVYWLILVPYLTLERLLTAPQKSA